MSLRERLGLNKPHGPELMDVTSFRIFGSYTFCAMILPTFIYLSIHKVASLILTTIRKSKPGLYDRAIWTSLLSYSV